MSVPLTAAQARTLAELVVLNDGHELALRSLEIEDRHGPLWVELGSLALTIDESGICSLADPEAVIA